MSEIVPIVHCKLALAAAPRRTRASLAVRKHNRGGPHHAGDAPGRSQAELVDNHHEEPCYSLRRTASNTVGSVRGLRTGGGGELASSPETPRPPSVVMPSIERTCGRPSCSCAQVCRVGAAGPARTPGRTQISTVRPSLRTGSSRGGFVGDANRPPPSRARARRCLRRRRVPSSLAASCSH